MSKKDEALKLAREWIGESPERRTSSAGKMVALLTEALAEQPAQQEPVGCYETDEHFIRYKDIEPGAKLYTSPPASKPWVGLTDVEWMNIVNKDHAWFGQRPEDVAHEVAKLVEAKLREKNS